jgi:uncharacterized Zn finger protein
MYGYFAPYVSVAQRRKNAEKAVAKLVKQGRRVASVKIEGRAIARTFWGKSWCEHLESFSDFSNRLPRGRTYVRNGSVIHLAIEQGRIAALVQGSSLYEVTITIDKVAPLKWTQLLAACAGEIGSLVELLQGRLSGSVMRTITDKHNGLFPQPREIALDCSCPDGANMCKHVAAVLYGVGARFDAEPELLFKLRHVDHLELISQANFTATPVRKGKAPAVEAQDLSQLFGIEIEAVPAVATTTKASGKTVARKKNAGTPGALKRKRAKASGRKPPGSKSGR